MRNAPGASPAPIRDAMVPILIIPRTTPDQPSMPKTDQARDACNPARLATAAGPPRLLTRWPRGYPGCRNGGRAVRHSLRNRAPRGSDCLFRSNCWSDAVPCQKRDKRAARIRSLISMCEALGLDAERWQDEHWKHPAHSTYGNTIRLAMGGGRIVDGAFRRHETTDPSSASSRPSDKGRCGRKARYHQQRPGWWCSSCSTPHQRPGAGWTEQISCKKWLGTSDF